MVLTGDKTVELKGVIRVQVRSASLGKKRGDEGRMVVQVHYYEDGNVQLMSTKEVSRTLGVADEAATARNLIAIVKEEEDSFQVRPHHLSATEGRRREGGEGAAGGEGAVREHVEGDAEDAAAAAPRHQVPHGLDEGGRPGPRPQRTQARLIPHSPFLPRLSLPRLGFSELPQLWMMFHFNLWTREQPKVEWMPEPRLRGDDMRWNYDTLPLAAFRVARGWRQ